MTPRPDYPTQRVKYVCELDPDVLSERTPPSWEFDYIDIGSVTLERGISDAQRLTFGDAPSRARKSVRAGDVIVSTVRTYLKAIGRVHAGDVPGVASTGFAVCRAKASVEPAFLFRAIQSDYFIDQVVRNSVGVSYPAITSSVFANLLIPLPDLPTQKAIAAFLDRETARIDQLIEKKQRLVELLGEREKSVPSDLIPSGRMVLQELLGQAVRNDKALMRVPIKALFRLAKRQGFPEKTILSVYREHGVIVRDSRHDNINKVPMDVSSYQLVEPGDLVINKMKAWQGSLGISPHEGITSPDYVVMVPTQRMQDRYISHLLRARPMPDFYRAISNGIRPDQWRLEVDRFLATSIYLPSPEQQERIADEIDHLIASHRSLADRVQASIDRLKEYRSALITAAVTGQIDVETWRRRGEGDRRLDQIEEEMAG